MRRNVWNLTKANVLVFFILPRYTKLLRYTKVHHHVIIIYVRQIGKRGGSTVEKWDMEEYLERNDRNYDYYLFWSEEFIQDHFDDLILCESEMKTQITCSHILMDEGQEKNYQEDGFILGEIIFEMIIAIRKEKEWA
jgi:hypothetical protein